MLRISIISGLLSRRTERSLLHKTARYTVLSVLWSIPLICILCITHRSRKLRCAVSLLSGAVPSCSLGMITVLIHYFPFLPFPAWSLDAARKEWQLNYEFYHYCNNL